MLDIEDPASYIGREQQLFEIADTQAAYFTAAQALEVGFTYRAQHHYKAQGRWLDRGFGIFRLRDYPWSENEELARLTLWSRTKQGIPQAVVSHETALRLYELSDLMPSKVHLTVPKGFRKAAPGGVVLHKAEVQPGETELREGFQVTRPLRTLLDAAASFSSPEHLEQATLEALERGLVRPDQLREALASAPKQVRARFTVIGELHAL